MIFTVTFIALYAAHMFADHWVQRHHEATTKGAPGRDGRAACWSHVMTLTGTKAGALLLAYLATGVRPALWALPLVLFADALTHYWADRAAYHPGKEGHRVTLEALAHRVGKTDFWNLGKTAVDANGRPASSLGTGAYALDQSFHVAMLFVAALVLEVLS